MQTPRLARLAWFVGIWVASVATMAVVAGLIRVALP